ncbi:MAG TPA: hypothetical protein VFY85_01885 [Gemmatimonadaceae bacterium]|nr:hypothetical protein [Gemmatimonadaceae bacterium]
MTTHGKGLHWSRRLALAAIATAALGCTTHDAVAPRPLSAEAGVRAQLGPFAPWTPAVRIENAWPGAHPNFNSAFTDGCPSTSRDGRTFFMASTRPGSRGIDIWVSRRESVDEPWGEPANVGEPINSAYNDFCPMLARDGHEFFFVSNRPGGCGGDDIYVTRFRDDGTIDEPENLGCDVNSAGNEAGPVPITEPGRGPVLYFSSTRAGGFSPEPPGATSGDADLYSSEWRGGHYQPPTLVPGVNSAQEDGQPYIQRDALELYFFSTRPGGKGAQDIWMASRATAHDAWSAPVNLGDAVNSPSAETRPSLSWDGTTLYFGSTRSTGEANIYVSSRDQLTGRR